MNTNDTNKFFLPAAVIVAGLFIAGAVMWSGSDSSSTTPGTPKPIALTAQAKKIAADVKENRAAYQALVDSDKAEAGRVGISATPSFLIGKQMIAGAYPYASFQLAIDNALAGKVAVEISSAGIKVSKVDSKDLAMANAPFIGKADAPVTLAFWSDFQCPFCKAAEVGGIPQIPTPPSLPEIIENYVETGKVKVVFMDFAFLGPDSTTAALYNRSVWKLYPDQYFEWRTAMYTAQDEEHAGFGNADSIDQLNARVLK